VAKWEQECTDRQAELVSATDACRSMMSLRSPRGRDLKARKQAAERRLATARYRLTDAEKALEQAVAEQAEPKAKPEPKVKTLEVPTFKVRGTYATVQISEQQVHLVPNPEHGCWEVEVQTAPCTRTRIGSIEREGTGWTARSAVDLSGFFRGDHFPTRTGKHTRTYAVAFLIAVAAGQTRHDATYNLRYDGVSA
jgi:hypothetical protein